MLSTGGGLLLNPGYDQLSVIDVSVISVGRNHMGGLGGTGGGGACGVASGWNPDEPPPGDVWYV